MHVSVKLQIVRGRFFRPSLFATQPRISNTNKPNSKNNTPTTPQSPAKGGGQRGTEVDETFSHGSEYQTGGRLIYVQI